MCQKSLNFIVAFNYKQNERWYHTVGPPCIILLPIPRCQLRLVSELSHLYTAVTVSTDAVMPVRARNGSLGDCGRGIGSLPLAHCLSIHKN